MTAEPPVDAINGKSGARARSIERRFSETEARLRRLEHSVRADMRVVMEALEGLKAQLLPLIEATPVPAALPAAAEPGVQDSVVVPHTGEASAATREVEMAWYHRNRSRLFEQYAGEWIAVSGGGVVAPAPDLAAGMREGRGARHPRPFLPRT